MNTDDIIRMARVTGLCDEEGRDSDSIVITGYLERFAKLVVAAEREACAKVAENMNGPGRFYKHFERTAAAIRERDAQPEPKAKYSDIISDGGLDPRNKYDQQPVAWRYKIGQSMLVSIKQPNIIYSTEDGGNRIDNGEPLYTAPPQREWQGLMAEDLAEIPPSCYEGAIWADARLKEKNT